VSAAGDRSPESLLVVRLGAMGDIIHTLPAVTALRSAFPETKIGWVVEDRWAELLRARESTRSGPRTPTSPLVDFVHTLDTKAWRKSLLSRETQQQISKVRHEIRDCKYEIAVDFQGAMKSAVIARLSGARMIFGMANPREAPARIFYHRRVATTGAHVIEQYHSIVEAVAGRQLATTRIEFPCDDNAERVIAKTLRETGENFVLINPGAGWAAKQWPAERYGEVARELAKAGLAPLVNFGPGEKELARAVESASDGTARLISCTIAELIGLTRRARLFIGGDTGPLHLAAALGVPVVAIFGPTDPARNGPYGTRSTVLRNPDSRTSLSHTNQPDPGLLQITTNEVVAAAKRLLETTDA
jgi:heptosyltransferase-1